ncbi:hypothetical protein BKA93DRAFT_932357 [Sparassis latifolia]
MHQQPHHDVPQGEDPCTVRRCRFSGITKANNGGFKDIRRLDPTLIEDIPNTVPINTVNRQCSSGLSTINHITAEIVSGQIDIGIGGCFPSELLASFSLLITVLELFCVLIPSGPPSRARMCVSIVLVGLQELSMVDWSSRGRQGSPSTAYRFVQSLVRLG